MRHIPGTALLAAAILLPGCGEALAAEPGSWYLGAGVGRSMFSSPPSNFDTFASIRASGYIKELGLRSSGGGVYGGFRVNRYFALEAGYADLGKITFTKSDPPLCGATPITVPIVPGSLTSCPAVIQSRQDTTGEISSHAWNLGARVVLPLGERFELSGKLGVLRSTTTLRATQQTFWQPSFLSGPVVNERTARRTSPLFGVGMSYRISPGLNFTLDWEQSKVGSADTTGEMSLKLLSAGVRFDL